MLSKSPEIKNNCTHPMLVTGSARQGLKIVLEGLKLRGAKSILLPAYIGITDREGSGVFDPVLDSALDYAFYEVGLDLSASKENLYALIKSNKYSVLLVIHYFGFCQNNMEEISALCKEHGVVLIEDCAHTMFGYCSGVRLGSIGDFSIFSVHKILSVENGGILQVNSSEYLDLINKVKLDGLYCDVLGEVLMSDLECVRSKRRDNYCALMNVLVEFDGIEMMYPDLPEGVSPHNMPIIIRRGRREEVYFKLIDLGIPVVALYYRMISAISAEVFKDSIYLSENILNLPVHQDVDSDDVISVREAFRKIYG